VFVLWSGANGYISKEPFSGDIGTSLDTAEGAGDACWIAFFVARDMTRIGWLPKTPSLDSRQAYCAVAVHFDAPSLAPS
jgi:hypothetical protein